MSHRLLDEWPLDESELNAAQREALERKLAESPELQDQLSVWQSLEAEMNDAPSVGPKPGFTERWQARLAERRLRRWNWQVRGLLGLLMMGAFVAALLIGLDALASPAQVGAALIEAIVRVGQLLDAGVRFLSLLGGGIPALFGVLALSAALAWVSVVWVAAMYRYGFSRVQNGVR